MSVENKLINLFVIIFYSYAKYSPAELILWLGLHRYSFSNLITTKHAIKWIVLDGKKRHEQLFCMNAVLMNSSA